MDYPPEMQRDKRDSFAVRQAKKEQRKAYLRSQIAAPATRETKYREVERVVENTIEVPVERVVEKVVYRDTGPSQEALERMEAAKAAIDNREPVAASVPAELAEHVKEGETVTETKQRFLQLYRDLGNKIHMPGLATDADRRLHESLHAKMTWIVSD